MRKSSIVRYIGRLCEDKLRYSRLAHYRVRSTETLGDDATRRLDRETVRLDLSRSFRYFGRSRLAV
jgi:hypothetical protein